MADEAKDKATKLPPLSVLKSLLKQSATAASKVSELNGDVGQAIASAVEKHNLHASAFKTARKLEKMDPVKLNAWLTHFDDYRAKLELDKKAGDSLPLEDEEEGDEAAGGEGGGRGPMFTEGDPKTETIVN